MGDGTGYLLVASTDAASIAFPLGGVVVFIAMLWMIWTIQTNAAKSESMLRTRYELKLREAEARIAVLEAEVKELRIR